MSSEDAAHDRDRWLTVWLGRAAVALFAIGLLARVLPLLDRDQRLFWQYPTEDGYLMLTISRNLGIGKGISVSDGTIPTNGTQPLAMLLWALPFSLTGGDRPSSVACVLVFELLLSVLAALLVARLGKALFERWPFGGALARVAAGVWFASPVMLPHTMNCLESGVYVVSVAAVALLFVRLGRQGPWSPRQVILFGALLGVAFWARNDAIFLGAAFAVAQLALPGRADRLRRLFEVAGAGAVAALVGAPWLAFNVTHFGHLVPISGQSESMAVSVGTNLPFLPSTLARYLGLFMPIPEVLQSSVVVQVACALLVLGIGTPLLLRSYRAATTDERALLAFGGTYALLLSAYYGLFFGAAHFLARYLFPASPFFVLLWASALGSMLCRMPAERARLLAGVPVAAAVALSAGLAFRAHRLGPAHQHRHVVEWVTAHVPETSWVAASQSGTLGFFHDRTINLDGKVNPEALEARRQGRVEAYALSKQTDFIADWVDFAWWAKKPEFSGVMRVLVEDHERNVAVLGRHGAKLLGPPGVVP